MNCSLASEEVCESLAIKTATATPAARLTTISGLTSTARPIGGRQRTAGSRTHMVIRGLSSSLSTSKRTRNSLGNCRIKTHRVRCKANFNKENHVKASGPLKHDHLSRTCEVMPTILRACRTTPRSYALLQKLTGSTRGSLYVLCMRLRDRGLLVKHVAAGGSVKHLATRRGRSQAGR